MPALRIDDSRVVWPEGKGPNWKRDNGGIDGGKFGRIDHVVVTKDDGTSVYDKCVVHEGNHVISITYGRDSGQWLIGLVKEGRDTAAPLDGATSLAFWGPPRGYREVHETPIQAAVREAGEEAGASVIKKAIELGDAIVNETIVNSWSPFVALEVDLSRLSELSPDHGEKIYKARFFSVDEIERMIAVGMHDGASCRSMVLMSMLMLFKVMVLPRLQ